MEFALLTLGGVLLGVFAEKIYENHMKTHGVIEVDHDTEQCKIHITSDELSNRKTKKVIFIVNHDAKISREEQIL